MKGGECMRKVETADIAVLGGGASGLAAAVSVLETYNCRLIVAERLDRVGKKLLATGNGRCNLSNRSLSAEAYSGSVKNMMQIIGKSADTEDFFMSMGMLCVSDSEGRIYPRSNSASSVLDALRIKLKELGGEELCGFDVKNIRTESDGFTLVSDSGEIECKRLIIAAGGYASPVFGTDGTVMRILRNMGYKTSKICPAAAPLRVSQEQIRGLKGVRAKCTVKAVSDGMILREESGEIQFTDNALSGICVFNLAKYLSGYEGRLILSADFCPDMSENKLTEFLCLAQSARYNCSLDDFLTGLLTKKLASYIMKRSVGRPLTESVSELKYADLKRISHNIKNLDFNISGASPWQNAQVTFGGIHGSCVDKRLESKLHKGMYLCGEILDVTGDCGGFNLQWAWSSGRLAGSSCAESLRAEELK